MAPLMSGPILIAHDGTTHSSEALATALELAHRGGLEAQVFHAVDLPALESLAGRPDVLGQMEHDMIERATAFVTAAIQQALRARGMDIEEAAPLAASMLEIEVGHPAELLLERARALSASMIVLAHHQRRGLLDLGSTARALLAGAPCPVWSQVGSSASPSEVLVAVDRSAEAPKVLAHGIELARVFGAKVHVLHVHTPPVLGFEAGDGYAAMAIPMEAMEAERAAAEEALEGLMAEAPFGEVEHSSELVEGHATDVILERCEGRGLLVLGSHGRRRIASLLMGNTAWSCFSRSPIPVVALRVHAAQEVVKEPRPHAGSHA